MTSYLFHVKKAMQIRGHHQGHTFYRMIAEAHEQMCRISTACLYVGHEGRFSVANGSMAEGPIPPAANEEV